jgi:hypothetical protein
MTEVKASTARSNRKEYTLDETLAIIQMFEEGLKPKEVEALTGRSAHSLRYKFLEGEIVLNGKSVIRSVKRFKSVGEIYAAHGVELPADVKADVKARIDGFRSNNTAAAV